MGNVVSCTHCQSTLKWTDSSFEIMYNSNTADDKSSGNQEASDEVYLQENSEISGHSQQEDMSPVSSFSDKGRSSLEDPPKGENQEPSPVKEELYSSRNEDLIEKQSFFDVEQFGNSEINNDKGFLRYNLYIENIDSTELEQEILHILEDPKFNWEPKKVLSDQKDNTLLIKNLNPVKVFRLISELSRLSVKLHWKQYTVLESASPDEELSQERGQESV